MFSTRVVKAPLKGCYKGCFVKANKAAKMLIYIYGKQCLLPSVNGRADPREEYLSTVKKCPASRLQRNVKTFDCVKFVV